MKEITGGVTAPKGFKAAGVAASIKPTSTKKDCAIIASDVPCAVAGVFTTNVMKAPCVHWNKTLVDRGSAQAIFVNSGNANAATGEPGMTDVKTTVAAVARGLGIAPDSVAMSSTGVIGFPLPMDRIMNGVNGCLANLSTEGGHDAALAIMTTDTVPKEFALEFPVSDGLIRIGAMAKGSGMIAPNMATMLSYITTDAAVDSAPLQDLLRHAVNATYNCICIDNDMSTSDTVLCLANGRSGTARLAPGTEDFEKFSGAFLAVCGHMARQLVLDGEGATKFVVIDVAGATSDADAQRVAKAIAHSHLCKTAFFGEDPNWGRIACAAGYSGTVFNPSDLAIWLDRVQLVANGQPTSYREEDAAAVMKQKEFGIRVELGSGPGTATFWTTDLSHDYVSINADYRS
ncbi:MAG: arginine biosynthesis bifunctional protein ArgJ [Candidatus Hydrogenedentota bacterium]